MLKKSSRTQRCCRIRTNRIRIELLWGALSLRQLATRMGLTGTRATERLAPFLWQMERRTGEDREDPRHADALCPSSWRDSTERGVEVPVIVLLNFEV